MAKKSFLLNSMGVVWIFFFLAPLSLSAQPRYNVVKDYGFENNDTIWVEYKSTPYGLVADRHTKPGYESQFSGLTNTLSTGSPGTSAYCYLEQKLIKRTAKDYNLDKNLKYYFLLYPPNQAGRYDYWYISFSSQKKKLIFIYAGANSGKVPNENDTTHIVEMDIPFTDSSWVPETLNFYEKWTEKFSEADTIEKIRLAGYYFGGSSGSDYCQTVNWDNIVFESTHPDSDAAVVSFDWYNGYPTAWIANKGAVAVSFPVISDFYNHSSLVYSDTTIIPTLAPDYYIPVLYTLPPTIDEIKVRTALSGDQNPANDTLSKNLGVQEVEVKHPLAFRVWPVLTRRLINYESEKSVTAFDPTGRMMVTTPKGRGSFVLEKTGVYFVKSGRKVQKVVRIE